MITNDMSIEEIDAYITDALFDVLGNRKEDVASWEPYGSGTDELVDDFVRTYFKYNKYIKG